MGNVTQKQAKSKAPAIREGPHAIVTEVFGAVVSPIGRASIGGYSSRILLNRQPMRHAGIDSPQE